MVKNPHINAGDLRDAGSIPGWGRSPGGGHGNAKAFSKAYQNTCQIDTNFTTVRYYVTLLPFTTYVFDVYMFAMCILLKMWFNISGINLFSYV